MPDEPDAREAPHGKKMIEVRVRFWTDAIAERKGQVIPKHGWDAGVVLVQSNTIHGIDAGAPIPFNGMAELPSKIEKALIAHGIKLHLSGRAKKYLIS
jgi:hypothetical protein